MQPTTSVAATTIATSDIQAQVRPSVALRVAWKTTLLNAVSGGVSVVLLILGYLQTLDLSHILTPSQALMWTAAVNIATIVLRAVSTKPIVVRELS